MKTKIYLLLGSVALVGLSQIWIGVITPIQVRAYEATRQEIGHIELEPELTIEEHICKASNGKYCDILINLAKCESSLRKDAMNVNTNGTVDIGIFQINTVHQDISNSEKFDVYAATRWTVNKLDNGKGHIWVCWNKI